jgi:hypothetical protein
MSHFGSAATGPIVAAARPGLLLAALVASAMALGGCAGQQGTQEAHAGPTNPQPAYCERRPAPDCEFRNASLRTVDPTEFARLKLAYERRCIRRVERAERRRMRELQASGACEDRPAPSLAASR